MWKTQKQQRRFKFTQRYATSAFLGPLLSKFSLKSGELIFTAFLFWAVQLEADTVYVEVRDQASHTGLATSDLFKKKDPRKSGSSAQQTVGTLNQFSDVILTSQTDGGQLSQVSLQGVKSEHVLGLWNGVSMNDKTSPGGAFDFSLLPQGSLQEVEVLSYPQVGYYGGEALGGAVLFKSTEKAKSIFELSSLNASGYNLSRNRSWISPCSLVRNQEDVNSTEEVDGFKDCLTIDLAVAVREDYRFSQTESHQGQKSEVDGSDKKSISLNFLKQYQFHETRLQTFFTRTQRGYDGAGYTNADDPNASTAQSLAVLKLNDRWELDSGGVLVVDFYFLKTVRRDQDDRDALHNYFSQGLTQNETTYLGLEHNIDLNSENLNLQTGVFVERQRSSFKFIDDSSEDVASEVQALPVFRQKWQWRNQAWTLAPSYRVETAGPRARLQKQWDASYDWPVDPAQTDSVRLRSLISLVQGERQASFYQRQSQYGKKDLQNEKVESLYLEQGFTWQSWQLVVSGVDYHFSQLIEYDFSSSRYANIKMVHIRSGSVKIQTPEWQTPAFSQSLSLSYSRFQTRDSDTNLELLKRPDTKTVLDWNWNKGPEQQLTLSWIYSGPQVDYETSTRPRVVYGSHTQWNLKYSLCSYFIELYNILDKKDWISSADHQKPMNFIAGFKKEF